MCQHDEFGATVDMERVSENGKLKFCRAKVSVRCVKCGESLMFYGVPATPSEQTPFCSPDRKTVVLPCSPDADFAWWEKIGEARL